MSWGWSWAVQLKCCRYEGAGAWAMTSLTQTLGQQELLQVKFIFLDSKHTGM
jgi:hypothetical protein